MQSENLGALHPQPPPRLECGMKCRHCTQHAHRPTYDPIPPVRITWRDVIAAVGPMILVAVLLASYAV